MKQLILVLYLISFIMTWCFASSVLGQQQTRISQEPDNASIEFERFGVIEEINPVKLIITIDGGKYLVDDTVMINHDGKPIIFDDFHSGMPVQYSTDHDYLIALSPLSHDDPRFQFIVSGEWPAAVTGSNPRGYRGNGGSAGSTTSSNNSSGQEIRLRDGVWTNVGP